MQYNLRSKKFIWQGNRLADGENANAMRCEKSGEQFKIMKTCFSFLSIILAWVSLCSGAVVLSDNFNADTNGNLVGQNGWTQTGATITTPIQVNGGVVSVGGSGQDAYKVLPSTIMAGSGNSFYVTADIVVTATHSADYFLHSVTTGGDTSGFYDLLYVKGSAGATFNFGIAPNSSSSTTVIYGSGALSLNTDYRIVLKYTFVSGGANDQMTLYVNPANGAEANDPAYVSYTTANNGGIAPTYGGTDPISIDALNFRQGSSASLENVDNVIVATSFNDTVPVPESAAWGMISGLALLGICGLHAWGEYRAQKPSRHKP